MIAINSRNNLIEIKILGGPTWSDDLSKVKSIDGRKYDGPTKLWTVPSCQIKEILSRMGVLFIAN